MGGTLQLSLPSLILHCPLDTRDSGVRPVSRQEPKVDSNQKDSLGSSLQQRRKWAYCTTDHFYLQFTKIVNLGVSLIIHMKTLCKQSKNIMQTWYKIFQQESLLKNLLECPLLPEVQRDQAEQNLRPWRVLHYL